MGILLAGGGNVFGLGYVSTRTVFVIGAAFVALAAITVFMVHHHRMKNGGKHGSKFLNDHHSYKKHWHSKNKDILNVAGYSARAYDAVADDTDPDNIRTQIMNTISNSTSDQNQLHNAMGQILAEINSNMQVGGPLNQAIAERRNGHIDAAHFHDKLGQFVKQICDKHHIPIVRAPYGGGYGRYGNVRYNNYIKKLLEDLQKRRGYQHHYPFFTSQQYIPPVPPVHTYPYPSYPTPYMNFSDYSVTEPGLCNPGQRYHFCLGKCVPYDNPVPDNCAPSGQSNYTNPVGLTGGGQRVYGE